MFNLESELDNKDTFGESRFTESARSLTATVAVKSNDVKDDEALPSVLFG